MEEEIILTKVSDSKIKKSVYNVAIYETNNGLTMTFTYNDDGYIENEVTVRRTNEDYANKNI